MPTFLVTVHQSGPEWDPSQPIDGQSGWERHAAFMDALVDDGFIVLGGPVARDRQVVHAIEADSEEEVLATLARDPWSESHLVVASVAYAALMWRFRSRAELELLAGTLRARRGGRARPVTA